jgi:hydrogenase nickel incorporation protein HypA/HybF
VHEYSIVGALLHQVETEALARGATSVGRVRVALGELSGVDPELLETAYRTFRERTFCRDAELQIRTVPACWVCPSCGRTFARGEALRCLPCQAPARLESGDEILLEQIEMEVA